MSCGYHLVLLLHMFVVAHWYSKHQSIDSRLFVVVARSSSLRRAMPVGGMFGNRHAHEVKHSWPSMKIAWGGTC